jgi:hypothetical protein
MMSEGRARSRALRITRLVAISAFSVVILILCVLGIWAWILNHRAEESLAAIRTVQVGKSTGEDAARIAKKIQGTQSLAYLSDQPYPQGGETTPMPLEQCIRESCWIQFPFALNLQTSIERALYAHPTLLGWTPIRRVLDSQIVGRRMHAGIMAFSVFVKDSRVQNLEVAMYLTSADKQLCPEAITEIADGSDKDPPWAVRHFVKSPITGGACGSMREVSVNATPYATQDQLSRALNYNLRCMWPGVDCKECDMLSGVCDDK